MFSVSGVYSAFRNVKVNSDLDHHTVDPLRSLIHTSIEKRKGVEPIADAAPNNCTSY